MVDGQKVIAGEHSEQRAPKEVQKAAKSESIASSSEGEVVTNDFETAEGTFSSEQEEEDLAEEHDIQPKKRSRRRHRESSMTPTARGSSSPSTSQEENQRQVDSKDQRRKNKKGKDHKKKGKPKTKNEKEASNSSPECDRLSESEKLRIDIFERFYGQLCCEISNPIETAAQLQKKGLISIAVVRDMMRSPESQQEKTIALVDKLNEIIKSKPDCLFTFIETLLENEALQKVGSEILTETGKYIVKLILHSP